MTTPNDPTPLRTRKYPDGKPLGLLAAKAALRSLLRPHTVQLKTTSDVKSCFLDAESSARFYGPTWEDVVDQALRATAEGPSK